MGDVDVVRAESRAPVHWVSARACWVPPNVGITIAGHHIPDGMLYVGHGLPAAHDDRCEPALIDTELPLRPAPSSDDLGYWPSYDTIRPAQRSTYLHWLADGRRDPDVPIGFVFLFFYGLERRLLHDREPDPAVRAAVRSEVQRLIEVYGAQQSFRRYASEFGDLLDLIDVRNATAPGLASRAWPPPMALRLGLAEYAARSQPLPARWALAWAWYHPEITLRATVHRCWPEFEQLFVLRYGDGLRIPLSGQPLCVSYRPASAGLQLTTYEREDSHDVFLSEEPVRELRALIDSVTEELDPYGRRVQRHPGDRGTVAADALLPADLLSSRASVKPLRRWAFEHLRGREHAVITADQLVSLWPGAAVTAVAKLLSKLGIGIEPDPPIDETTVLFRSGSGMPSDDYGVARAVAGLAVGGIVADDVSAELDLPEADRARLRAHVHWLTTTDGDRGRQRFRALSDSQRATAGELLLAHASRQLSPDTMTGLMNGFRRLGLDPSSVPSRLHQSLTARPTPAAAPVVVQSGHASADVYALPSRDGVPLDHAAIAAKLAESADVSAVLQHLLADDEVADTPRDNHIVPGLDAAHAALLRKLAEQQIWAYEDFARLADQSGLLPAAALDALNEAALEAVDEPLIDGDTKLEIDPDVLEELLT